MRGKRKIARQQILRRGIQITAFLLIPGFFADTFHALQSLYSRMLANELTWSSAQRPLLVLLGTIPATILFGRYFCGWLCSFGAMQDLIWGLFGLLKRDHGVPGQKADQRLRTLKYGVLIFFLLFVWTGVVSIESLSPWTAFGQLISPGNWNNLKAVMGVDCLMLLVLAIGSALVERFFCRYLCPMGAIYSVLSRFQINRIRKGTKSCGNCHQCSKKCAMGIDLQEDTTVTSGECIRCMCCTEVCPRQNRTIGAGGHVAAIFILTGTVVLAQIGLRLLPDAAGELTQEQLEALGQGSYKDGSYTGTARGYRGETTVTVTVQHGNIQSITVDSTDDDEQYINMAKEVIPEVLSSQNLDVDAVSGATLSSFGILYASRNALPSASIEELIPEESGEYVDGIYEGAGAAFRGDIEAQVTVENGNIIDIRVLSYYDDLQYLMQAINGVIPRIIEAQELNVDAVSGATYSSNGILRAAADALGISEDSLNLIQGEGLKKDKEHGHRAKKYLEYDEETGELLEND